MEIKGKAKRMVKSLVISYLMTAVVLFVLALVMYKSKMSISGANGGILFTYVISSLLGGLLYSGSFSEKRYLGGGLFGVVYFLIVYCVSAFWNHSLIGHMPGMLTAFLICVFSGMLGGMLRSGMKD